MEEQKPEVELVNGYPKDMQYYQMTGEMNDKFFNAGGGDIGEAIMMILGIFVLPFMMMAAIFETIQVPYIFYQRSVYKWKNRAK